MNREKKTERLLIPVTPKQHTAIKCFAQRRGQSISHVVRQAVKSFIERSGANGK